MAKFVCGVCGYIYDEDNGDLEAGIEPGTKFEDLPDDFECPLCSVGKDEFSPYERGIIHPDSQCSRLTVNIEGPCSLQCGIVINISRAFYLGKTKGPAGSQSVCRLSC